MHYKTVSIDNLQITDSNNSFLKINVFFSSYLKNVKFVHFILYLGTSIIKRLFSNVYSYYALL